jgi:hypothetical protein
VFRPFSSVLRARGARLPLLATFLGSMPIGMLGLGLLLLVRHATHSYAEAGAAVGALSLGNAAGLLLQGRLIDRYGPAPVLLTAAVTGPPLLVGLMSAVTTHHAAPLVIALAAAGGATLPATVTGMRVLWPRLVSGPAPRAAAYALLGTLFQVAMVLGPLLVSALQTTIGVTLVLPVAAALATAGGILFAAAPAARAWRPDRRPQPHPAGAGAVEAGVVTLVVGSFGGGLATGMLTVALAAARPTLAGLLFAAFSAGELLGGLAYGGRAWRLPAPSRLLFGQCGMAGSVAVLAGAAGYAWLMLPVTTLIGALTAPVSIANSALLDDVVASGSLARAYTVLVSAGLLGMAAGSAAAGQTAGDVRATLLVAAGVLVLVAVWSGGRRRTLAPAVGAHDIP